VCIVYICSCQRLTKGRVDREIISRKETDSDPISQFPAHGSLIHHSDRGVQYACGDYAALLHAHGIQASMSRVANPYDNAKAESFMKTLKQEEVDGRDYRGTNENTNGLMRQYFPKGADLRDLTQNQLAQALKRLNHRPRKCLGFQTPHEVISTALRGAPAT